MTVRVYTERDTEMDQLTQPMFVYEHPKGTMLSYPSCYKDAQLVLTDPEALSAWTRYNELGDEQEAAAILIDWACTYFEDCGLDLGVLRRELPTLEARSQSDIDRVISLSRRFTQMG